MSEVQIPMSVPLDSDGFIRRECPTCERELKWRPTSEGEEGAPTPEGGYFFKQSLTTGWDCPRAEVMMSFRKAKD
jgi:hypothetical protein